MQLSDPSRDGDISVPIFGEAHKPQKRRQFRINYELILSEILLLTVDRRGSLVRNADFTAKWIRLPIAEGATMQQLVLCSVARTEVE